MRGELTHARLLSRMVFCFCVDCELVQDMNLGLPGSLSVARPCLTGSAQQKIGVLAVAFESLAEAL